MIFEIYSDKSSSVWLGTVLVYYCMWIKLHLCLKMRLHHLSLSALLRTGWNLKHTNQIKRQFLNLFFSLVLFSWELYTWINTSLSLLPSIPPPASPCPLYLPAPQFVYIIHIITYTHTLYIYSVAYMYIHPGLTTWDWQPVQELLPGGNWISLFQQPLTTGSSSSKGIAMWKSLCPHCHDSWCHCAGLFRATALWGMH